MWYFAVICCALLGISQSAYTSTTTGTGFAGASAGTGSYGGGASFGGVGTGGYGGGYGGSYGGAFPFAPIPSFENRFGPGPAQVTDFLQSLQNQQAASISMTSTNDDATAHASSSLSSNNLFNQQLQHQATVFNNIQDRFNPDSGAGSSAGGSISSGPNYVSASGPNYASASASYGPGGVHQTASISPPNPVGIQKYDYNYTYGTEYATVVAYPNVNTRFDSAGGGGGASPGGSLGVSTSSFSSSADVNGVKSNRRGAVTTVNDNGKVSTYYTHS